MTVGRKTRMFYFMMGGLTIFKNKSKCLVERKSHEDSIPLERSGTLLSLCKVLQLPDLIFNDTNRKTR